MSGSPADAPEPDVMELYDAASEEALVCRTCGAMVPRRDGFPRTHWDWHEASNGA
jgi:hypothetical protein